MRLTHRDHEIVAYLAFVREATVMQVASLFFGRCPQTGNPSKDPRRAAMERLRALKQSGRVLLFGGGKRVRLTRSQANAIGSSVSAGLSPTMRAHHDITLAAIEDHRARLGPDYVFVDVSLEGRQRSEAMKGRGVRKRPIGSLADAVVIVHGPRGREEHAIEVVTRSYTDDMIKEKFAGLGAAFGPQNLFFYADAASTARRTTRLSTGAAPCRTLK